MAEKVYFNTGEVIFNENEHSSYMYILNSGKVAVFKGTEKISEIDKPGSLLGEMSLFMGEKRTATVIALSKVELERISKENIQERISDPEFALAIIESLAEKLNQTSQLAAKYHKDMETLKEFEALAKDRKECLELLNKARNIEERDNEKIKEMFNFKSLLTQKIINPFIEQTKISLRSILNIDAKDLEPFRYGDKAINIDAASIVNIKGDAKGIFILAFPRDSAINMTSRLMDKQFNELTQEVVDFIMELNNVIIGLIVSSIKEFNLTIETPIAVFNNHTIKEMIKLRPALVVPFITELGEFYAIFSLLIVK